MIRTGALGASLLLVTVALYGAFHVRQNQRVASIRPPGIPATVPTSLADLMQLSAAPELRAPDFRLTDQSGRAVSLASLRGRVVVLEFMDPHCTGICPNVPREFIDAYRDLGGEASRVVFVAVNLSQYHLQVADVAAFSREQQLTGIPTWYFLTGAYPSLRAVWSAYGVEVYAPGQNTEIILSPFMYFIDPQGRERYLANPMAGHTTSRASYLPADQLKAWASGIALVARYLAG